MPDMKTRSDDNAGGKVTAAPSPSRPVLVLGGCFVLLLVLGWLDYRTGYELGFFVFYSLPVGLAAWYVGRWPGVAVALGATLSWWLADSLAGARYSSRFSFWWNSTIHFLAFVINAVAIAKIKTDVDQRHELAAQLDAARQALRTAAKLLPACPICGKARAQNSQIGRPELREAAQTHDDLSGALCAECQSVRKDDEVNFLDPGCRNP